MMLASVGNHVIEGCWSVSQTCQHMCVMADLVKFVMVCVVTVNLGVPLAVDPTLSVLHLMILEWGFDDGWMLWMEYCYVYPPTTCDCEEYTPSISCMLVVHVLPFHTKSMLLPHQRD